MTVPTNTMQTKDFELLYRELVDLPSDGRLKGYVKICSKLTNNQKAKLIVDLFDKDARNQLMIELFNARRYAQAGIVSIYQNAIDEQQQTVPSHDS
ncbi:MAG: hypothetical protein ACM3ZQ_07100 [Bacillota bacterium]